MQLMQVRACELSSVNMDKCIIYARSGIQTPATTKKTYASSLGNHVNFFAERFLIIGVFI